MSRLRRTRSAPGPGQGHTNGHRPPPDPLTDDPVEAGAVPADAVPADAVPAEAVAAEGARTGPGAPARAGPRFEGRAEPRFAPRFEALGGPEADAVAVVDSGGRFRYVSASAGPLLGYDLDGVVGSDVFALFEPSSVPPVRSLFDDLVANRRLSFTLELRTLRADGTPLELEAVAANHLDDPLGGIVVEVHDVTGRGPRAGGTTGPTRRRDAVFESLVDGVLLVDPAGTVVRVNEAFEVLFETPRVRLLGRSLEDLGPGLGGVEVVDGQGRVVELADQPLLTSLRSGRRSVGTVLGVRRADRPTLWVRADARAMVDPTGRVTGAIATFSDVTPVRRATVALRREQQFLQVLLGTLEEGIVACDADGRVTVCNPAARRMLGLPDGFDPIGTVPTDHGLRRPDGSPMPPREHPLVRAMSGELLRDVEVHLDAGGGELRKVSVNGQCLVDDDRMLGAVVAMHDVTEQKLNEERLSELALHDPLTGLANRALLAERLQQAIDGLAEQAVSEEPRPEGEEPGLAVYLLDLDDFKEINDVLGHDVGDDMLVAVARRLAAIVRPSDTVARLGGDEFVVLCRIDHGEEEMVRIADRISTALARPYRIDGRILHALASVGGVFVDHPDTDPSKLLSQADDAMYGVKWARRRQRRAPAD